MKLLWLLLIPVIMAVRIVGADHAGKCNPAQPMTLTEADNGKTLQMKLGEQIKISLSSNPATGYKWKSSMTGNGILVQVDEPVFLADPACAKRMGCGGLETFSFKATQSGTAKIKLVYQRPWEEAESIKTFEIAVIVG